MNFFTNIAPALLTIVFGLCLMYSVMGAIITGALIVREKMHPCFMCLFGLSVPASMIGLGFSWFDHLTNAVHLMIPVTIYVVAVSYCARRSNVNNHDTDDNTTNTAHA